MRLSLSTRIYIGLVVVLAALSAVSIYMPTYQGLVPTQDLPASKEILAAANAGMILVFYGLLGFIGLKLSQKMGFAALWDTSVSNRQRFLVPAIVGVGIGIFIIVGDVIFSRFNEFGRLPHPQFPVSLIASLTAGIGEELIFRLFFVSFWVWLISYVILRRRWQNRVFWITAVFSAIVFAAGHIPSFMILYNFETINDVPPVILLEGLLLNGTLSIFAAYYFRKYGFLAAVGIHFWADVVWHVIWGAF
ncbi:type II CAAX prenyl endopeptidase Rce1 family protein [Chloroflexota bacterium]